MSRQNEKQAWKCTVPLPFAAGNVEGFSASIVTFPQVYVLVAQPAAGFFDPVAPDTERRMDIARSVLAERAGIAVSPTIPKIGLVAASEIQAADLLFRTRTAENASWHCGAAGSGLLALATAALLPGSVVHALFGDHTRESWRILTPAGIRVVELRASPDGRLGLQIDVVVTIEEGEL